MSSQNMAVTANIRLRTIFRKTSSLMKCAVQSPVLLLYLAQRQLSCEPLKLLQVAKCSLLPQSAQNTKPENIPCRSAFVGRRLFSLNSCTRSKTASSTIASWVLWKIACCSFVVGIRFFSLWDLEQLLKFTVCPQQSMRSKMPTIVLSFQLYGLSGKAFPFFFA